MLIKIAVLLSLASVLLGTLIYFIKRRKRAKEAAKRESAKPVNNAVKTDNAKKVVAAEPTPAPKPTPAPAPVVATAPKVETVVEQPKRDQEQVNKIVNMLTAISSPRPTDAALARHYDEMIEAKTDDCLNDEKKLARLVADYEALQNSQAVTEVAAPAPVVEKPQTVASVTNSKATAMPEDAALRRHFLAQLRADIEKTKAARPTDSSLRRHYDAMIDAEIEKQLAH